MREAIVTVRHRDGQALGIDEEIDVFHDAGLEDAEVVTCEGTRGVVRFEVESPVDHERLAEAAAVTWFERIARDGQGSAYLVEFDIGDTDGVDACADQLLRCETVDVGEERFTLGMAGSQDAIRETIASYEGAGADLRLETLTDFQPGDDALDALTARQREVLERAYDEGYFDVPRGASTDDLAAALDVDTSTVSEHLRRAERNLLASLLDR